MKEISIIVADFDILKRTKCCIVIMWTVYVRNHCVVHTYTSFSISIVSHYIVLDCVLLYCILLYCIESYHIISYYSDFYHNIVLLVQ